MVKPRSTIVEYRWGVFAASEPTHVRTIHGCVTILVHQNANGAPLAYQILLSDAEGRPMQSFQVEDFSLFVSAAYAACEALGLRSIVGTPGEEIAPLAKLVTLADAG